MISYTIWQIVKKVNATGSHILRDKSSGLKLCVQYLCGLEVTECDNTEYTAVQNEDEYDIN